MFSIAPKDQGAGRSVALISQVIRGKMNPMTHFQQTDALDRLLDPVTQCFTPEVAKAVVNLRAESAVQARIDELAEKANEGELSAEERAEYEAYVDAIDLISILQAKARRLLAPQLDA